jgi:hypothetical protein
MKCCQLDTNDDGNCPIHAAPGVLRIRDERNEQIIDKCATSASHEFFALLRNWTGFDARIFHRQRLEGIITEAITKVLAAEDLNARYYNDARFHAFVDRACAEVLERNEEAHRQ